MTINCIYQKALSDAVISDPLLNFNGGSLYSQQVHQSLHVRESYRESVMRMCGKIDHVLTALCQ